MGKSTRKSQIRYIRYGHYQAPKWNEEEDKALKKYWPDYTDLQMVLHRHSLNEIIYRAIHIGIIKCFPSNHPLKKKREPKVSYMPDIKAKGKFKVELLQKDGTWKEYRKVNGELVVYDSVPTALFNFKAKVKSGLARITKIRK